MTECAPHLVPWLPLLAMTVGASVPETPEVKRLDARYVQDRLRSVVSDLLSVVLVEPTLLIFEDTHWLDEASRELLSSVADVVPRRPWLLVATHRPQAGALDSENARSIALQPLSARAAKALAIAVAGDSPLGSTDLSRLVSRAGGNPLFVRELRARRRLQRSAPRVRRARE